jgi:hypothetical protein
VQIQWISKKYAMVKENRCTLCRYTWLTSWSRVLFEKLIVTKLVKRFPAFYGTRRFITVFTTARLNQMHPVHTLLHYLPNIHSNITPSTPRSSEWSFPFRYSDWKLVWMSHLSHTCCMSANLIILGLITKIMFGEAYKLSSSSLCNTELQEI